MLAVPKKVLADCTRYSNQAGEVLAMTTEKRDELEALILTMVRVGLGAFLRSKWIGIDWDGLAWRDAARLELELDWGVR